MQKEIPLGVILVGSGRIGAVHCKNIIANPRLKLKYIVDIDLEIAKKWASLVNDCKISLNLDEPLKDPEVVGVIICTPTATHKDLIIKSVRAKKHVMCEKPISLQIEEIDECYLEAKKNGVFLLCGYQRRSDPSFVQLQQTCKSGNIGKIQIVKTISRDNPVPTLNYLKISGGIFHDCGSHDLDVCRWILGEDPIEIYSVASAFNPDIAAINDFDTVLMTLKFPSGAIASVDLSRKACYGYDQRIEVLGSEGMVQAMNRQPTTVVLSTERGILTDPYCFSFPQRYDQTYAIELDHFVDVMLEKVIPKLSHDDARKVAIIANAAEESARSGQKVIIQYDNYKITKNFVN